MTGRIPKKTVVLDTNMFIYAQDYGRDNHDLGQLAAGVLRALGELGYTAAIAESTLKDLQRGKEHKDIRLREAQRYPVLRPGPPGDLHQRAGYGENLSANDECDLEIMATLDQGMANWLITNDDRMISHANRAGLHNVLKAKTFLEFIELARNPQPLPLSVDTVNPSDINIRSEFFESLRATYPEFVDWWASKVVEENRVTLVVGDVSDPLALAVLKEDDADYGLPRDTTKICTFKVSTDSRGYRYGELLLTAVLRHIRAVPSGTAFVEVAENNELFGWLGGFGFEKRADCSAKNGDAVMVKRLTPGGDRSIVDPWVYHVAYGPGALRCQRAFRVPIRQKWHKRLFPPGGETQQMALMETMAEPCGNAITKVYISHTRSRQPERGDVLLFVETKTDQRITNIGIVEDVIVTTDPIEVIEFAETRTVYSPEEVKQMCRKGMVHVMRFRHDRVLTKPWNESLPGYAAWAGRTPQSIAEVGEEGLKWLQGQLGG